MAKLIELPQTQSASFYGPLNAATLLGPDGPFPRTFTTKELESTLEREGQLGYTPPGGREVLTLTGWVADNGPQQYRWLIDTHMQWLAMQQADQAKYEAIREQKKQEYFIPDLDECYPQT